MADEIKFTLEKVKTNLIFACITNNPKSFIPYLLSSNVVTAMPNKMRFFRFFEMIVISANKESDGKLQLKKEQPECRSSKEVVQYNFYDSRHEHARISIEVIENDDTISIDVLPF